MTLGQLRIGERQMTSAALDDSAHNDQNDVFGDLVTGVLLTVN